MPGLGLGVGVILINPAELRWTQLTAGGRERAQALRENLLMHGWDGPPIDVVQISEGLVTVDHTRAAVALELDLGEIPTRVHLPEEPLPLDMIGRFKHPDGRIAHTWGEAIEFRAARQNPPLPPYGTTQIPRLP